MTRDTEERQWVLREMDLFRDLDEDEVMRIGEATRMTTIPAGQLLYSPERPNELLFIVKRGRVRLFQTNADGRTLTTAILAVGDVFGEMHALGQRLERTFAETLEPCVVCVMSRSDVERLLLGDPRVALRITEQLGARVIELERRLGDTVLKPIPQRIAALVARLALASGPTVRLTHEQLADLVGTTRETVTKVLGALADRRLVALKRGRIIVPNAEALRALSDEDFTVPTGG